MAEVFRGHGEAFRKTHSLTSDQARAMRAIETCRTAALGGHVDVCDRCLFERPAYNSCRNRHCPKCQNLRQAVWLDRQMKRILPTHYFHVVFTLPEELRGLAHNNPKLVFDLLFEAASQTLLELGRDQHRLGAHLGFTAVLHTWTRDLRFHPHLHCIVTGGGLCDSGEWLSRHGGRYLFPVKVMGRLFRGKFLAALLRARNKGELVFAGRAAVLADNDVFAAFKDRLYSKEWVVYAKRPFGGVREVYAYLGRYTHRVGLSNYRLQQIDATGVRFSTKDGKCVTLDHQEFIRRFLLHVLPAGFVKIRHYGLYSAPHLKASLVRAKVALARQVLIQQEARLQSHSVPSYEWRLFRALTGVDLYRCPLCQTGVMAPRPLSSSTMVARPPPTARTS